MQYEHKHRICLTFYTHFIFLNQCTLKGTNLHCINMVQINDYMHLTMSLKSYNQIIAHCFAYVPVRLFQIQRIVSSYYCGVIFISGTGSAIIHTSLETKVFNKNVIMLVVSCVLDFFGFT